MQSLPDTGQRRSGRCIPLHQASGQIDEDGRTSRRDRQDQESGTADRAAYPCRSGFTCYSQCT